MTSDDENGTAVRCRRASEHGKLKHLSLGVVSQVLTISIEFFSSTWLETELKVGIKIAILTNYDSRNLTNLAIANRSRSAL